MLTILVDGEWDTSLEETKDVLIYEEGTKYIIQNHLYNDFIDSLETKGYDCYFCIENFSHPEWSGIIKYIK